MAQKNTIHNNYKYYYTNFTNDNIKYNLYLGGHHKISIEFSKYEFPHLTGLGQYLKELNNGKIPKNEDIIRNIKQNKYILESFDSNICKKHFVKEKMTHFQQLQIALEIDFTIYKYHQNKYFPNEQAEYVTKSHFVDAHGKDTTILLFLDFNRDNGNYYIRSFVANPTEIQLKGLENELKTYKILYKEKEMDEKSPICLQCEKEFQKEKYVERLSNQDIKIRQNIEKRLYKRKMEINNAVKYLDSAKSFLTASGYTIYNRYVTDDYYIVVGKRGFKIDMNDPENIRDIAKALKKIVSEDNQNEYKYKRQKENIDYDNDYDYDYKDTKTVEKDDDYNYER